MTSRKLISEHIYQTLRDEIITGILKPEHRLVELELAKRFKSSQAPVRESLRMLQEQGLVEMYKHAGTIVAPIRESEMRELFELRGMIERNAARRAQHSMTPEDQQALEQLVRGMQQSADEGQVHELVRLDMAFHHSIILISGRKVSERIWRQLDGQIRRFLMISHPKLFEDYQLIVDKHVQLLQTLLHGEEEDVERAFEEHVTANWERIRRFMS